MDEIDLELCVLLAEKSRTPYRELAEKVDLSVNAVHSRVQKMIDMGILQEFYAKISTRALKGSVFIWVEGKSNTEDIKKVLDALGDNENIFKVVSSSSQYLYVEGLLKDITEMNDFTNEVKEKAQINDPKVFIPDTEGGKLPEGFEFSKLDYQIIYSMHKDSRKPLSDVAEHVGVSSKTVRRRLNDMEEVGAIEFGIKMRPTKSSDFICFLSLDIRPKYDRKKVMYEIRDKYFPNINDIYLASNEPRRAVANAWAKTLDDIHELKDNLRKEGYFDSIRSQLFYDGRTYDTWRDDLLIEKAKV